MSGAFHSQVVRALIPRLNPHADDDQTLASSNAKSRNGPQDASATPTGHNRLTSQK